MNTKKLISFGKGFAIAVLILGIIHDIATFTPIIQEGLVSLNSENLNAMIYMSLICGTSFILSGLLMFLFLKKLIELPYLILPIRIIGTYLLISGILSVIFMHNNPFAYIALLLNATLFTITILLKKRLYF